MTEDAATDDRLDLIFSALAHPVRRRIALTLSAHPESIANLADREGISLPAIHRHVVALEAAGLVERRKSGRVNFLALARNGVIDAQHWLDQFHAYWGSPQESLDNYIAALTRTPTRGTHR